MATRETIRPLIGPAPLLDTGADLDHDLELGDAAAFQKIAARYDRAVLSLLLALTGSEPLALDLCHFTLLAAHRRLQRRRPPSLYICFYRLAVEQWLDWVANHARIPARDGGALSNTHQLPAGSALSDSSLSPRERVVFTLKAHSRLGLDTVAQILDLPRETAAAILTRAVAKLRLSIAQR
jgi:DNA-directed RNA polymerase specialized sigma24 family protein